MPEGLSGPSRVALPKGLGAEEAARPLAPADGTGTELPPLAARDPRRFAGILCTEVELGLAKLARRMEFYNPSLVQGLCDLRARAAKLASDVDIDLRGLLALSGPDSEFSERREQLAWSIRKNYTLLGSGIQAVRDHPLANPVQRRAIGELQEAARAISARLQALVEVIPSPEDQLLAIHAIPDFQPQDFEPTQ